LWTVLGTLLVASDCKHSRLNNHLLLNGVVLTNEGIPVSGVPVCGRVAANNKVLEISGISSQDGKILFAVPVDRIENCTASIEANSRQSLEYLVEYNPSHLEFTVRSIVVDFELYLQPKRVKVHVNTIHAANHHSLSLLAIVTGCFGTYTVIKKKRKEWHVDLELVFGSALPSDIRMRKLTLHQCAKEFAKHGFIDKPTCAFLKF